MLKQTSAPSSHIAKVAPYKVGKEMFWSVKALERARITRV